MARSTAIGPLDPNALEQPHQWGPWIPWIPWIAPWEPEGLDKGARLPLTGD